MSDRAICVQIGFEIVFPIGQTGVRAANFSRSANFLTAAIKVPNLVIIDPATWRVGQDIITAIGVFFGVLKIKPAALLYQPSARVCQVDFTAAVVAD